MGGGVVVVVDANPGSLMLSRNILVRAGFEVHTAPDPDDACNRIRTEGPDLLLLDVAYAWPHVLVQLEEASFISLPIILLAPAGMGEMILADLRDEGASNLIGVVEKPFVGSDLSSAVTEALLDSKKTRQLEIRGGITLDTLQETIDAESACDILGVRPVVEVSPVHEPGAISAIQELRSALEPPPPPADERPLMQGRLGDITPLHILQFAEGLAVPVACRFERHDRRAVVTIHERHVVGARRDAARRDVDDADEVLLIVAEALEFSEGGFAVERVDVPATLIRLPVAAVLLDGLRQHDEAVLRLDATIETPRRVPRHLTS